jgi:hypothetical protein
MQNPLLFRRATRLDLAGLPRLFLAVLALFIGAFLGSCSTTPSNGSELESVWELAKGAPAMQCSAVPPLPGILYVDDVWQKKDGSLLVLGVSNSGTSKIMHVAAGSDFSETKKYKPILQDRVEKAVGYSSEHDLFAFLQSADSASSLVLVRPTSQKPLSGIEVKRFELAADLRPKQLIENGNNLWLWSHKDLEAGTKNLLYKVPVTGSSKMLGKPVSLPREEFAFFIEDGQEQIALQKAHTIFARRASSAKLRPIVQRGAHLIEGWTVYSNGKESYAALAEYDEQNEEKTVIVSRISPVIQKVYQQDVSDTEVSNMMFLENSGFKLVTSQYVDGEGVLQVLDPVAKKAQSIGRFRKPQVLLKQLRWDGSPQLLIKEKGKYFWRFKLCRLPG